MKRFALPLCAGLLAAAATISIAQSSAALHGASFLADGKISGSSLTGFHTVGGAQWTVANGEITAKGGSTGGWLVSDKSYQDTGVYVAFQCTGTCDAGIAVRMEKTANGLKANFLSLKDKLGSEDITIDASGKLVSSTEETRVGAMIRFAPPPNSPAPGNYGPRPGAPGPNPLPKPKAGVWPGQWNEVEALVDADIFRGFLNEGGEAFNAGTKEMNGYGPFALYVGPNSEVRFKDVIYKDLAFKKTPIEAVGQGFKKQEISPFYYGWSADAADFNHDGKLDIVSGAYLYFGPDYTVRREIVPSETANPSNQYRTELYHAFDYNKDGWPDILSTNLGAGGAGGAFLYVNPKGESRRWDRHKVLPSISSEESVATDLDGDGIPEIIYIAEGFVRYAKPGADPTQMWTQHDISEKGQWSAHGIGTGDVNGDGKIDILTSFGWWEQPKSGLGSDAPWTFHEQAFGRYGRIVAGGARIGVYDVNGDGLADVVTALEAHGWGLAWYEQKRDASGNITFVEHLVMDNLNNSGKNNNVAFSELHGAEIADVDGDGIPDYIVGKRVFSHQDDYFDPDPYSGGFLYWFKTVRDKNAPGGAVLEPHLIHNWSGAGSEVRAIDLNGDGKPEIITSTKLGTFIFWNEIPKGKK